MVAPLSWLKEYVDITLAPESLGERLTEIGLGCEKITKQGSDTIFELEITPNRPDLLSIMGVAREIAAIESKKVKYPKTKTDINVKPKKVLPLKIETNSAINPRFTGIIIEGIHVKESPTWLRKRLESIGQRPINNIVDITNYVMLELGNPLHAFDYDKIKGNIMRVHKTKGGEKFTPLGAQEVQETNEGEVVYADEEKILCRKWNYRDCDEAKISEGTRSFVLVVDGAVGIEKEKIESAAKDLSETLEKFVEGCKASVYFLST